MTIEKSFFNHEQVNAENASDLNILGSILTKAYTSHNSAKNHGVLKNSNKLLLNRLHTFLILCIYSHAAHEKKQKTYAI